MVTDKLFTELFRPKSLDGLILPERVKGELSKGLVQNTIYYGPPGIGKSTIANILTAGYDTLKLNGSAENGIETIRNQVVAFASSISLENGAEKLKVIRLEECDGLTTNAWDALRDTIERFREDTFIYKVAFQLCTSVSGQQGRRAGAVHRILYVCREDTDRDQGTVYRRFPAGVCQELLPRYAFHIEYDTVAVYTGRFRA